MTVVHESYPYRLPLNYTDGARLVVLHDVDIDNARVKVIGDPENGAYEWIIEYPERFVFSDCGYGQPGIALRDGLDSYCEDASISVSIISPKAKTRVQMEAYRPRRFE